MRMQSPASSGLLPASYSRRRRNRPNESLANNEGSSTNTCIGVVVGGGTASSYYPPPTSYGDSNNSSGGSDNYVGRNSPRRSLSSSSRKPLYTLTSHNDNKSSDDDDSENEENDGRRSNAANDNSRLDAYEEGYEDVLDKPLKLSDFLINDRCYQRHLLEGKRRTYRGIGGKNSSVSTDNKGFMDPSFLAKVCAGTSFVGMLFLIFVAIIMETQPLFIKGVSVKSASSTMSAGAAGGLEEDDGTYRFRKETSNALKAAAAYFLTMVCSLVYLQAKDMNLELNPAIGRICHMRRLVVSTYFRYKRRHYDAIPDGSFGGGGSSGSMVLPMHHGNGEETGRQRRKRRPKRKDEGDVGGGAIEGVLGKIKSWGIGGGSSRRYRKKER